MKEINRGLYGLKKIIKATIIILLSTIIFAFVSGCIIIENTIKDDLNQGEVAEQMPMLTDEVNLKYYDEEANTLNIITLLEEVEVYSINVECFLFKDAYSNFKLLSNGIDAAGIYAYYNLANTVNKGSADVRIRMSIENEQSEAKVYLVNFVLSTTAISVYSSTTNGIYVGDLAIGNEERLTFIRGNVYVDIIGSEGVSIVNLAKEIDQQILDLINKQ